MSTAHVLLGLLTGHPQHGYELKHAHDTVLPQAKPLAFGQVYATLGRLERDGLVAATAAERAGGPERTSFAVTTAGRTTLDDWLNEVEPPVPHVTSALLTKVVVAPRPPVSSTGTALKSLSTKARAADSSPLPWRRAKAHAAR